MGKTHEALLKAEKENKMNYLAPVRKPEKALVPAALNEELMEPCPEWCKEIKARLNTQYPGDKIKSIMFTATSRKSGCSRTAVGFAISLAKSYNHRVLLIDANLRNPGIHKFFNDADTFGLFDVLMDNNSIIDKQERERLLIITSNGDYTEEVDGFLGSERYAEFMKNMRKHFDYIIMDSPPIASSPEIRFISSQMDGVILMLESGKTRRPVALKAKKEIEVVGGKFLGTILNRRKYYIPKWIYCRL